MKAWLIFLERTINSILVGDETIYVFAATEEGASLKAMEYFIEDGWEVIGVSLQAA